MQSVWQKFSGSFLIGLCLVGPAFPQGAAKADDKSKAAASAQSLDAIIATEDPNARITALQQFLKANANNVTAREALVASYAQLGENYLNDHSIEKAVDAFQRAIRALPKQVSDKFFDETVSRIPMAISTRGYRAEAVAVGKLIETRFASDPVRLAALGEFYLTIEASGEAIATLEQAAKLAPEDPRLHRALGSAYRMGLRIDDAIASYQLAVRFSPQDRRAFYDLANLYRSQGAYEDAIKLYRRQLEIEPKHTPSLKGLALALTALGKDDEATAELNKARDLRGSLDEITQDLLLQTQLAFYYLTQNKLRQARQAADAALAIEPRFSWARIVAAEIELSEGKFFEAERHLLEAQKLANFPTLAFTLGKVYLTVEDFDGAVEQFARAFRYSPANKFTARLGGVRNVQSDELRELLAPEHQAAIFLAESPTPDETFRIAESLVRVNSKLAEPEEKQAKTSTSGDRQLESAARGFVQAEGSRRSFRALFMANKLAQAGRALPLAIRFADQALDLAEIATEAEGSVRDYPNYDREGRLHIFRGRAHDARGWSLFKSGHPKEAIPALSQAVYEYGNLPEGKRALWHLATAHEAAGAHPLALEMYLAAYEPPATRNGIDIQRTVIESIYRRVNGSLAGLNDAIGKPLTFSTSEAIAASARTAPPLPADLAAAINAKENTTEPANAVAPREAVPVKATPIEAPPAVATNTNKATSAAPETVAISTKQPSASKAVETAPQNTDAAKKPADATRVGLFNIPVNNRGAKNAPIARGTATAPVIKQETPANLPSAPQTAPTVTAQNTPPANTTSTPVKEIAKTLELPPVTLPDTLAKNDPPAPKPETKPVNEPERAPASVAPQPEASKPTETTTGTTTETAVEKSVTTQPVTETATAPKAEPEKPVAPEPTRVPDLTLPNWERLPVKQLTPIFLSKSSALAWMENDETPAPPAPEAPKPKISATAATTGSSVEPRITVRYENLPANPASSTAPAGESGHAVTPAAPVASRPRRVAEPAKAPAPESTPSDNSTRQRRAPSGPVKP